MARARWQSYARRMGRFIYDSAANSVDIEDRTLAHLRIVVMNKLRRSESFMFDVDVADGSGRRSFWMSPSVPIQFHFFGSRQPRINREWVEELMVAPQHRGAGIGRALMTAAELWGNESGAAYVCLATRRAAGFYSALGYEPSASYFKRSLPGR